MRHRIWFLTVALALALAAPAGALAQSTDDHARADEQFHQAREALTQGNDELALRLFRASQEIEPGRGKLLNIALCEEKLGLLAEATVHFEALLPQLTPGDERRAIVQQHLADLRPRVPHVAVKVPAAAPPAAALAPKPAARKVAPQPMSSKRKTGFLVGGAGLAGLAVGGVTGILALVDRGAIQSQCPSHRGCSPEIVDRASAGKALSITSTFAFVAGAVGASAGLYLVLTGGKSAAATKVGLTLLPDGGRVGVGGVF
jgi:hypothetical protein